MQLTRTLKEVISWEGTIKELLHLDRVNVEFPRNEALAHPVTQILIRLTNDPTQRRLQTHGTS